MLKEQITIKELYSLEETLAKELLEQFTYPWEVLPHIGDFIKKKNHYYFEKKNFLRKTQPKKQKKK